jgi:DNA-binding NtrC family response regulator
MRILIVDDNQELASAIQIMLEDEGYEIKLAKDGQDGYWAYLEFKPELVLTDIHMPGENGLELMGHIRTHNPMVRTIYMSGDLYNFLSPIEEEKKRYPVSYLEKPFSKIELIGLVSGLAA